MENQTRYPLNVENQGNLTENERKLLLIWQSQGFDKASLIQEKAYLPIRQGKIFKAFHLQELVKH